LPILIDPAPIHIKNQEAEREAEGRKESFDESLALGYQIPTQSNNTMV